MLFYKSDDAAELGGKSMVSAVLEKFMMVGITAVVVGVNMTNVNFIERIYARRGSGSIVTDQARGSAERHFDLELSSKELLQTGALVRLLFLVRMIALKNLMGIKDNA